MCNRPSPLKMYTQRIAGNRSKVFYSFPKSQDCRKQSKVFYSFPKSLQAAAIVSTFFVYATETVR
jgi:hypothetical protein